MHLVVVLLLAVVQGIGEFVPISSSGHLAIGAEIAAESGHGLPDVLGLSIVLHGGTLLSILVYYRQRILRLLGSDRRVLWLVLLATLPAVIVGLPAKKLGGHWLESAQLAAWLLPLNGLMLIWSGTRRSGEVDYTQLRPSQALTIGLAQAVAILPGISRSGSTIVAGLLLGLRRDSAATFSFLLAIPAIGGACVLEVADLVKQGTNGLEPRVMILGAAVSFAVGLISLRWLLEWLNRGRLYQFGLWCIAVGIGVLVWQANR